MKGSADLTLAPLTGGPRTESCVDCGRPRDQWRFATANRCTRCYTFVRRHDQRWSEDVARALWLAGCRKKMAQCCEECQCTREERPFKTASLCSPCYSRARWAQKHGIDLDARVCASCGITNRGAPFHDEDLCEGCFRGLRQGQQAPLSRVCPTCRARKEPDEQWCGQCAPVHAQQQDAALRKFLNALPSRRERVAGR